MTSPPNSPKPTVKYCWNMLNTLLVSQYSTRPAGVCTKKKRYINGMNAIERIIACC